MDGERSTGGTGIDPLRLTLIAGAIIGVVLLALRLADILLLMFAAIVLATILRSLADILSRYTRLPLRFAVVLVSLGILVVIVGAMVLFGTSVRSDLMHLATALPATLRSLGGEIGVPDLYERISGPLGSFLLGEPMLGQVANYTGGTLAAAATALLVVMGSVYLALDPDLYRRGLLRLVPLHHREAVAAALDEAAQALHHWLMGQIATTIYIAVVTSVVLLFLGLPHAVALGIIAGAMEFVPYVGGLGAAIPALLVALSTGDPMTVLWVAVAYLAIQQFEGNVLSPLVQQWVVRLPPVVGLFSLIAFGVLFGPLGVLLAIPLTVVAVVIVKHFYVSGVLKDHDILAPPRPLGNRRRAPATAKPAAR